MKRGPRHGAPVQFHRVKLRHRRHDPCTAHLGHKAPQRAPGLRLAEFHCDGPAGSPAGVSHLLLKGQRIQLDHHPVCSIGEVVTLKVPMPIELPHVRQGGAVAGMGVDFESGSAQPVQGRQLLAGLGLLRREVKPIGHKIHLPAGHHLGVQLAQGARTGIAGIGKGDLLLPAALLVDGGEGGLRQKRLTTDFCPGWRVRTAQPEGDGANGADTGGDLLSPVTVSPCGPLHQQAMLIAQGQGHPVHLQLTGISQGLVGGAIKMASQPLLPLRQLLHRKDVVQAEQRNPVGDAGQTGLHRLTHPLGGAIGPHHLGVTVLQLQQFLIKTVILLIRQDRRRQNVIGVTGFIELLPQGFYPGLSLGKGDGGQAQGGVAHCFKA